MACREQDATTGSWQHMNRRRMSMSDDSALLARAVQSLSDGRHMDRRTFMRGFALVGVLANMLLSGCDSQSQRTAELIDTVAPTPTPRLRAAFSHLGLDTAWEIG